MEIEPLAYAAEATVTEVVPVGRVRDGVRVDVWFEGIVVDGKLAGGDVRGIDYLLLRPDGVGVVDLRETVHLPGGSTVTISATGYVVGGVDPLPADDDVLDPGFAWPGVDLPMHGSAMARAALPGLAWMNRTMLSFAGSYNLGMGTRRLAARGSAFASAEPAAYASPS